ncbi:MAG: hypothetical protein CFE21_06085 [Bacteroidetes bacterium B1(2017)]|nr:MAG: hypothetical protein CFE21_06085 [Bacteroidetes bacterium B1(2017)]
MKKSILTTLLLCIAILPSFACTTFVMKRGNELVFGRNLDWVSDNGVIVVNKRNTSKTAIVFAPDKAMQWTSKYGSVTFNQFGKEFPFGGMNEQGLVVEIMLAKASYPLPDERPALNELQWIQYQLDNSASIKDVIESDKLLRISKINQDLHFLICDAAGKVAVIEFIDHKMKVYKDQTLPYPVLENDVYARSLSNIKSNTSCRFTKAAHLVQNFTPSNPTPIVDYSFRILDEVMLRGSWSIVYDITNRSIHFRTASNRQVRNFDMATFNFSCDGPTYLYDLENNSKGTINAKFGPYSDSKNQEKMQDAMRTNLIIMPKEIKTLFYTYARTCTCS